MTYHHNEAFKLMTYANADRSVVEILWNARDGVTPFTIAARGHRSVRMGDEKRMLSHVDWQNDRRVVDYHPIDGQRIFIDFGFEDYVHVLKVGRVENFWDHPDFSIKDRWPGKSKEDVARILAKDEWRPGTPRVVEVGKDGTFAELMEKHRAAQTASMH